MIKNIIFSFSLLCSLNGFAQSIKILNTNSKASLRGLSVVNNKIIWASGSGGTVLRSVNAGESWENIVVPGFEKTDFRDIHGFDKKTAVIMGIDTPAVILRTSDGGKTWKQTYYNNTKGMFLDDMLFWNLQSGFVIGDPIDGHFFVARTFDGGKTWNEIPKNYMPIADSGEACFAASGTNTAEISKSELIFVSGGRVSNLFIRDKKIKLPLLQGKETTGANAIAVKNKKTYIIVGGDFMAKDDTTGNCAITNDGGKTFTIPQKSPAGYRSGIAYRGKNTWISCGLNGTDRSKDGGYTFLPIDTTSFNAVKKAVRGKAVFLVGGNGRIGKLVE